MHFSFFSIAAIVLPLVSAVEVCNFTDVKPAPAGYTCGVRGTLAKPRIPFLSATVKTRFDCDSACAGDARCASLSMQGTRCQLYDKPLKQMGFKTAPKSGTLYWAAACFKKECHTEFGDCPGPTKDTVQWKLSNADRTYNFAFGGSYDAQVIWTQDTTNLPLFYLDKQSNICTGNKTLYHTGPEDSLHDPPWTMDLWKGSYLYLPEGARRPKCVLSNNRLQCSVNGTQELFYNCPPSAQTVILGSHNPASYCYQQEIITVAP